MLILGIETSCDECSLALIETNDVGANPTELRKMRVLHHLIHSQIDLHRPFGGVVPEIASRNHLETIHPMLDELLSRAKISWADLKNENSPHRLGGIAVTNRPGLIGALLVGVSCAKALAYSLNVPLVAVDHLNGHLHSIFLSEKISEAQLPLLVLLVSGGHTELHLIKSLPPASLNSICLGSSRDDAAGEAFDKCAKLMGLDYPGGKFIDALARSGSAEAYAFPRPRIHHQETGQFDFSFSGLKTSMGNTLTKLGFTPHIFGDTRPERLPQGELLSHLCASVQEAIVDTLLYQSQAALAASHAKSFAVVGGVSANSRLREKINEEIKVPTFFPGLEFCTDNAAMIACAGAYQILRGEALTTDQVLKLNAYSRSELEGSPSP